MKTPVQLASQALRDNDLASFDSIISNHPQLLSEAGKFWVHRAAIDGNIKVLGHLLKLGCDLNSADYTGTPLAKAAASGHPECVEWLLDHGASLLLDSEDISRNPLFSAIHSGDEEIAKLLISKGIDTKIKYPCGRDALAFAKEWGRNSIIVALGGDPNEKREPWVKTGLPDFTGSPMSEEMVLGFERELGIKVPNFFRNFLLFQFPSQLFHPEAQDNDNWEWLGPDYLMFHTARSYIAYSSVDSRSNPKVLLHPGFLVIGTNGGGDAWCIKIDESDQSVHLYEHEIEEVRSLHTDLRNHAQRLLSTL